MPLTALLASKFVHDPTKLLKIEFMALILKINFGVKILGIKMHKWQIRVGRVDSGAIGKVYEMNIWNLYHLEKKNYSIKLK